MTSFDTFGIMLLILLRRSCYDKRRARYRRKLRALNYADQIGNVSKTCRYFGISRDTFYRWKRDYHQNGEQGLINSKPCPHNPKLRTPLETEEKILYLRKTYLLSATTSWTGIVFGICSSVANRLLDVEMSR